MFCVAEVTGAIPGAVAVTVYDPVVVGCPTYADGDCDWPADIVTWPTTFPPAAWSYSADTMPAGFWLVSATCIAVSAAETCPDGLMAPDTNHARRKSSRMLSGVRVPSSPVSRS